MTALRELPEATTIIKFETEENCPRLVYVGEEQQEIEDEDLL